MAAMTNKITSSKPMTIFVSSFYQTKSLDGGTPAFIVRWCSQENQQFGNVKQMQLHTHKLKSCADSCYGLFDPHSIE